MKKTVPYDVVVAGGGLAGVSAAIAAARLGKQTALIQDRPVLGGNSSSEVRVTPHGAAAFHHYGRETGIISELQEDERYRNHEEIFENGWTNSVWDMVLYNACVSEENLELFLNTPVLDVEMGSPGYIRSLRARVLGAETDIVFNGSVFIDATGDGTVAAEAGCRSMRGSESKSEYGEIHAPKVGCRDDEMGNSLHFRIKDMGHPIDFTPPDWAVKHEDPSYFWDSGRKLKDLRGGFWWIEIAKPWDTIDDAETIRHELTRHLLGIWDWMKNKDPMTRADCRNLALDWIGQVPGKRESRRIVGRYLMTENDIQMKKPFDDEIAFGGWFLDLHTPGGLLARYSEERSKESYSPYGEKAADSYVGPFAIPYGVMIPEEADNLILAGRALSLTHAAFGSIRVMNTLALIGQAAGTAAARSVDTGRIPGETTDSDIAAIQQRLIRDGVFLIGTPGSDPADLARRANISAGSREMVGGADPNESWADGGIGYWKDQIDLRITDRLDVTHAQLIPVSGEVRKLSIYLSNESNKSVRIPISIQTIDDIWDYRVDSGTIQAETELEVIPGTSWHHWNVNLPDKGRRMLRLEAGPSESVIWPRSERVVPGFVSYFQITKDRFRTFGQGSTLCFSVEPPQDAYPPEQVVSGWTRPYRDTGAWRSSPDSPEDAWIRLDWDSPIYVGLIELTFPGQILREYHAYPPGYRDPQVPKDYIIEGLVESDDMWIELINITRNYRRRRRHEIKISGPIVSIRIRITATNGDPSASIYEIRCYSERDEIWNE